MFRHLCSISARGRLPAFLILSLALFGCPKPKPEPLPFACQRMVHADVVALDQVFFWNRLGAVQPQGMIYALKRDVVAIDSEAGLTPGNVELREGKRPRPLVLRMNVGDCLKVEFTNLLAPEPVDGEQPATRAASIHPIGLQLVDDIGDEGSNVGFNASSLVAPGESATYTFFAEREGQHVFSSGGAWTGGEGDGGQINPGLFGAINVEPRGSRWYRSQVTAADLDLARRRDGKGRPRTTAAGHPLVEYGKTYPNDHPFAGKPILEILDEERHVVHGDLAAIIAGPFAERYPPNPVYPDRDQPFREFTIIYHDEIGAIQAFPQFEDPVLSHTLHSVRDAFAINYGTGGVGAEILANRLGVGPMADCTECKYEEFFLSSWTVGDPAMVVDVPANAPCTPDDIRTGTPCAPEPGPKATKAFFPDDPSNVYHSYLRDHVKFRILHGGSKEHHIHHQHTHQWLFTPDSDGSTYLDSQAIGPGSSFTLEMSYNGSGNRNQAVGDSIFHCHFYPHFAQGMWAMWRVHDVFEAGTALDADGRPAPGTRALPDAEIAAGTPIPAVVPLPGLAMAPMPGAEVEITDGQVRIAGDGNPGYPFFIPGVAGHRPPHPPLDTIDDGGLPRHVITGGEAVHVETRLDFTKVIEVAKAHPLAEDGEPVEKVAMAAHAQREHPSFLPDGRPATFIYNGLPPVAGAPYADPCVDDEGNAVGVPRTYKAAAIQLDVIFNKLGWHFPQQRILTLWHDVDPTFAGERPPEPLFFRANTNDCIEYQHVNLVPNIYELDDFQVRTPTDILGQHIHLVKFDVTASDGSGNGWNYEDGTFSPDEVRERIHAIRAHNGCLGHEVTGGDPRDGSFECPIAEPHPFFGAGPEGQFIGAQTTVQRWFADDVLNLAGEDRTLRTVFTHDHYGPSTHQQAGLYAALVVEPEGSTWRHPATGEVFGSRDDGGPTSWRADILTPAAADSYREFLFEYADFALAYEADSHPDRPAGRGPTFPRPWHGEPRQPGEGFDNPAKAINPPAKKEAEPPLPLLLVKAPDCPRHPVGEEPGDPGADPLPCPEAVSADDPGTMNVNYRNEPVAARVFDPATGNQASGAAGDLARAFSSQVARANPLLNVQPDFYPPLTPNVGPLDPFTPLLQVYESDQVQIRMLVGAHEEGHNFTVNGIKWLFEPSDLSSGYRNSQMVGISEHFEFVVPQLFADADAEETDYLWTAGASTDDLWNGLWGLLRVFRGDAPPPPAAPGLESVAESGTSLLRLPSNPGTSLETVAPRIASRGVCPPDAPVQSYSVVAATAADLLPGGRLEYNSRGGAAGRGPLNDPTAILYVLEDDVDDDSGRLKPDVPIEPLVLRAAAGDCIEVTLSNRLPASGPPDLDGFSTLPMIVEEFNMNQIRPSSRVGLHPQLVAFNPRDSDGIEAGLNPGEQAPVPGDTATYTWYAGDVRTRADGEVAWAPIEFGAVNLTPADRIKQPSKGLIGALIIEPEGATWVTDDDPAAPIAFRPTRTMATVTTADGKSFREFVLMFQNDVNLRLGDGTAIPNTADAEDPEDSGQKAINFRTEPMWFRLGFDPDTALEQTREVDFSDVLSSVAHWDPETPIFPAAAGTPVRFRVLHPGGTQRNNVFEIHGHVWQQEPYLSTPDVASAEIGDNPLSLWEGSRMGHGPSNHFDAVLENGAGGKFGIAGDYLYRDHASFQFDGGIWGIFWVVQEAGEPGAEAESVRRLER